MEESIASIVISFGALAICFVVVWLLFQVGRWYKTLSDKEETYGLVEIASLYKVADELDIDIDALREKLSMIKHNKYDFRGRLQQKVYEDVFGELKGDKK